MEKPCKERKLKTEKRENSKEMVVFNRGYGERPSSSRPKRFLYKLRTAHGFMVQLWPFCCPDARELGLSVERGTDRAGHKERD